MTQEDDQEIQIGDIDTLAQISSLPEVIEIADNLVQQTESKRGRHLILALLLVIIQLLISECQYTSLSYFYGF